MKELLRHKVRFGELSYGPLMHNATIFDLLIQAVEEFSYEVGYTVEEIVDSGGVPYAPVAIHADIERYPRYPDTILVHVAPVRVGDSHMQIAYRLVRESDDAVFGTATIVHVTITPEGNAEPITPELRNEIESLGFAPEHAVEVTPRSHSGDGPHFEHDVVFRTPHLEAANLGYFEDYAREAMIGLEQFIEEQGRSLRSLINDSYPFVPTRWDVTLENSIRFENDITIQGEVLDVSEEAVDVAYEFRRDATNDVCIRADFTYGTFDSTGERVSFAPAALDVVR
nr:acyl-[acyl-carrier-protein] thioesterase [Natrinema soli]